MRQPLIKLSIRVLLVIVLYFLFACCEWNISITQWHVYSRIAFAYGLIQSFIVNIPNVGKEV